MDRRLNLSTVLWVAVFVALGLGVLAVALAGVSILAVAQMRRTESALADLIASVSALCSLRDNSSGSRLDVLESHVRSLSELAVTQRNMNDQQTALNNAFIQKIQRYDAFFGPDPIPPVKIQ